MSPNHEPPQQAADQEERLPFDLRTLFLKVWRRRVWIISGILLSVVLGSVAGLTLGSRHYRAETILFYKPNRGPAREGESAPSLNTQVNMVKIRANIGQVRERLKLPVEIETLAAAIQVRVQRDSELIIIEVLWRDPRQAAAIANTLRSVFLENQTALRYRKELRSVELLYSQAEIDKKSAEAQAANVGRIIGQLSNPVGVKKQDSPAEKLEDLNVRFRRLRDAIHDDKTTRANMAELNEKKFAFERAKEARARELISEADFRKAESEYEKLKALAVDTPQIETWKEEISKLDKSVIPTSSGPPAASPVLQEMTLKALNIDLEASSLAEKVERLKAERERLEKNLVNPAFLQRLSEEHSRDSQNQVNDKQIRHDGSEEQRRDFAADALDYVTVASAVAPLGPFKSTRSLIALAVVVAGSLLSFGSALAVELCDRTLQSASEASLKLRVRVLGVFAKGSLVPMIPSGRNDAAEFESFSVLSRKLRHDLPVAGARIMIASAAPQEDSSTIATTVAVLLGRQDERVLLLQAHGQATAKATTTEDGVSDRGQIRGVDDYLGAKDGDLKDFVSATAWEGVEVLPRAKEGFDAELLGSQRMRQLLDQAATQYGVVLVDAAPIISCSGTTPLACWCDGVVLVVKAGMTRAAAVKDAIARLENAGANLIGVVLTNVEPIFIVHH